MPWSKIEAEESLIPYADDGQGDRVLTYAEAIREALDLALTIDPNVFVMGQGVDDPSGMFGTTKDLHLSHGQARVFDTPLAETALTGVSVGAALGGLRPVYFHNRPDFLTLAMDQLVNHASKWSFMFGGAVAVPLVVWACIGRGWGSGAQHSQALQGLFFHVPGLKLVMPATPRDAKGLMLSAISDNNPVLIIDHRFNFKTKGHVPAGTYLTPLGRGVVRRPGSDATIVAVSHMATEACLAARELAREGIEAEVVDLRSLRPLDEDIILESLARTGRLVVADCGWRTGGVTAEISALASEKGFDLLKAPVARVTAPDLPTPSGFTLEQAYYPGAADIEAAVRRVLAVERNAPKSYTGGPSDERAAAPAGAAG